MFLHGQATKYKPVEQKTSCEVNNFLNKMAQPQWDADSDADHSWEKNPSSAGKIIIAEETQWSTPERTSSGKGSLIFSRFCCYSFWLKSQAIASL